MPVTNELILRVGVPLLAVILVVVFREIDGNNLLSWSTLWFAIGAVVAGAVLAEVGLRLVGAPKLIK
jgi:hypothetical protein